MDRELTEEVRRRAGGRCEYCHLPEAHVVTPFHIEHILPRQHGGRDTPGNLAYSCLRCNLDKGPNLTGIDPGTGRITQLFHPRRHRWSRHFQWDGVTIVGRTPVGSTTVEVLHVNDPERVALRQELLDQGLLAKD